MQKICWDAMQNLNYFYLKTQFKVGTVKKKKLNCCI